LLTIINQAPAREASDVNHAPSAVEKPTVENARTFLQELMSFWKEDSTAATIELSEVKYGKAFWDGLDKMSQDLDEAGRREEARTQLSAEAAAGVGISLTAGFVSWALRAGSMAASFLAAMPTWRHFDPLPVLTRDDEKKQASVADADDGESPENESAERAVEDLFDR
jgi:hypothetical protein